MTSRALLALGLVAVCGCAETDAVIKKPADPPAVTTPRGASSPSPARPAAQPQLRQELSPEAEQRLADGARQDIGEVERLIAELEGRSLKQPQREALQTAKNFLDEARAALGQRDYPRAANLANKARALTDDLAAKSK